MLNKIIKNNIKEGHTLKFNKNINSVSESTQAHNNNQKFLHKDNVVLGEIVLDTLFLTASTCHVTNFLLQDALGNTEFLFDDIFLGCAGIMAIIASFSVIPFIRENNKEYQKFLDSDTKPIKEKEKFQESERNR